MDRRVIIFDWKHIRADATLNFQMYSTVSPAWEQAKEMQSPSHTMHTYHVIHADSTWWSKDDTITKWPPHSLYYKSNAYISA